MIVNIVCGYPFILSFSLSVTSFIHSFFFVRVVKDGVMNVTNTIVQINYYVMINMDLDEVQCFKVQGSSCYYLTLCHNWLLYVMLIFFFWLITIFIYNNRSSIIDLTIWLCVCVCVIVFCACVCVCRIYRSNQSSCSSSMNTQVMSTNLFI